MRQLIQHKKNELINHARVSKEKDDERLRLAREQYQYQVDLERKKQHEHAIYLIRIEMENMQKAFDEEKREFEREKADWLKWFESHKASKILVIETERREWEKNRLDELNALIAGLEAEKKRLQVIIVELEDKLRGIRIQITEV